MVLTCFLGSPFSFASPCPAHLGLPVPPPGTVVPGTLPHPPPPMAALCDPRGTWAQTPRWVAAQSRVLRPLRPLETGLALWAMQEASCWGRRGKKMCFKKCRWRQPRPIHAARGAGGWKIPEAWASHPHHGLTRRLRLWGGRVGSRASCYLPATSRGCVLGAPGRGWGRVARRTQPSNPRLWAHTDSREQHVDSARLCPR